MKKKFIPLLSLPLIILIGIGMAAVSYIDNSGNTNVNRAYNGHHNGDDDICVKKPAIYLYPIEDGSKITVELDIDGLYTKLDPVFNLKSGWQVNADTDGTIHYKGKEYEYLFWEGELDMDYSFDEGFCVEGENTEAFLRENLSKLGLNEKETEDFIDYWLPQMKDNNYNVISFMSDEYTDHVRMNISPKPATNIRVLMCWYGSNEKVEIAEQAIETPSRQGFTLVEWGGCEVK